MTIVTCASFQLRQYATINGRCRSCHNSLGFTVVEIPIPSPRTGSDKAGLAEHRSLAGRLIRTVRLRQGLSQARLAMSAQTHWTYNSRIESGRTTVPSASTLILLLEILGVDRIYLRVGDLPL
jgi:hypothetical protein